MSGVRRGERSEVLVSLLTAGATWAAALSWSDLMELPGRFLVPLAIIAVGLSASGILLRRLGCGRLLGIAAQLGIAAALSYLLIAPHPFRLGASGITGLFSDAVDSAATYAAPVSAQAPSIAPLLISLGALLLFLGDALVGWLQRPALLGFPLLLAQVLPFLSTGSTPGVLGYAIAAGCYLAVLALDRSVRLNRWASGFSEEGTGQASEVALGIGALAVTLSVIGALLLPTWSPAQWGHGIGSGRGNDTIKISNPIADLQRDLRRGDDVPLLSVVTDDPDPSYLRIAVLTRFRSATWSAGDRTFPAGQVANGTVPTPPGLTTASQTRVHSYTYQAFKDFDSTWLPTPLTLTEIYAPGKWKYDVNTLDFLAAEDDLTTSALSYRAVAATARLSARQLAAAVPPPPGIQSRYLQLPIDLPAVVTDLADAVASGQPSKFQEAQALQQWFREDGNFTYSLDTDPGNGYAALTRFLSAGDGGRTGYCEQFASAMAVMARARGIPARVAVGFLTPEKTGPNTFVYSAHDLHAWPELYFSGAGWVRFEPTPGARAETVPDYTRARLPQILTPSASASPEEQRPSRGPDTETAPRRSPDATEDSTPLWPWLAVAGSAAALLVLAALPALIRRRRRQHRLAEADVESAWRELRDVCIDLGRPWPYFRSPRQTGQAVAEWFGATPNPHDAAGAEPAVPADRRVLVERPATGPEVNPAATQALALLVRWWEESRYSDSAPRIDAAGLAAAVRECSDALAWGATPRARRRARVWPRSAFTAQRQVASPQEVSRLRMEDSLRG